MDGFGAVYRDASESVGTLIFGQGNPSFVFKFADQEQVVNVPSYGALSVYYLEQETEETPVILTLCYGKKKRLLHPKEVNKLCFELHPPRGASALHYARGVLIALDVAVLYHQVESSGGRMKHLVAQIRGASPRSEGPSSPRATVDEMLSKQAEVASTRNDPDVPTPTKMSPDPRDEFTLIYEEESLKRRDLLSSGVQTIDGHRFVATWVTNRKQVLDTTASQDFEPVIVCVTRRGICMMRPLDALLSAYHWSEVRSFGAVLAPQSTLMYDTFSWSHRTSVYSLHLALAEELELQCNVVINQALGGTFASRALPKYYPPHPYDPLRDADGGTSVAQLMAKTETKAPRWEEQIMKGEPFMRRHRLFLDLVISNQKSEVLEFITDTKKPVDIEFVDVNGISGIYWACIMGHAELVKILLEHKASVLARDLTGGTPLHAAAYQSQEDIVNMLISAGADVNALNNAGQTPLHRAAVSGLVKGSNVCEFLMRKGSKCSIKDGRGNIPLHLAALQGDAQAIEALVSSPEGKVCINEPNSTGRVALHYAVLSGRKSCVEALLVNGADKTIKDSAGSSSVDIALREVADKEEREERAKAKGLQPTEALQPARDILNVLIHWNPSKAGKLMMMKRMASATSPQNKGRAPSPAALMEAGSSSPSPPASRLLMESTRRHGGSKAGLLNEMKAAASNVIEEEKQQRRLQQEEQARKDAAEAEALERVARATDQWTDSPVVTRRAQKEAEDMERAGIKVFQVDGEGEGGSSSVSPKMFVMPNMGNLNPRRAGSKLLDDDEKEYFNRSLQEMRDLKTEKVRGASPVLPRADEAARLAAQEEAARKKVVDDTEERLERMRRQIHEERQARAIQRHLDAADAAEMQGNINAALVEYYAALDIGPCEVATTKIMELEGAKKSDKMRSKALLEEIEEAARTASEATKEFSRLAGLDDEAENELAARRRKGGEKINAEEMLAQIGRTSGARDGDDFDEAEFAAALAPSAKVAPQASDVVKAPAEPPKRTGPLQLGAGIVASALESAKKPASEPDWHASVVAVADTRHVVAEPVTPPADTTSPRRQEQEAPQHSSAPSTPVAAAAVSAPATPAPVGDHSPREANEAPFDKKAYNAAVRAAKAFSSAGDNAGALREYQKAAVIRPGHEGVQKKVRSLKKKLGV